MRCLNNNNTCNHLTSTTAISSSTTTSTNAPENKQKDAIEYVICAYHALVTIVSICLVSIMFFKDNNDKMMQQHRAEAYIMSPSVGCKQWDNTNYYHGKCIAFENEGDDIIGDKDKLWGLLHMEERKAMGLFSSTNAAVVCLTAQVIAACLTAASAPLLKNSIRVIFSFFAVGTLAAFGTALLFLQKTWRIPGNNLIWLEIILICALMVAVDLASKNASPQPEDEQQQARIIGSFFSVPMLCIAGLVTAGESNAISLRISYVGLVGVAVLWLIEQMSEARDEEMIALRITPWLCLIPFIIVVILRLQVMAVLPDDQRWAIFELSTLLAWALVILIYFTISGVYYIWTINSNDNKNNTNTCTNAAFVPASSSADYYFSTTTRGGQYDGIYELNTFSYPKEENFATTVPSWQLKTEFFGFCFYIFHQLMHSAIVLLILIGLFVNAH